MTTDCQHERVPSGPVTNGAQEFVCKKCGDVRAIPVDPPVRAGLRSTVVLREGAPLSQAHVPTVARTIKRLVFTERPGRGREQERK